MVKHCLTCGCKHEEGDDCPAGAFAIVRCKQCKSASIMPVDALFGLNGIVCCQCNAEGQWSVDQATVETIKEFWPEYGKKKETNETPT